MHALATTADTSLPSWHQFAMRWRTPATAVLVAVPLATALLGAYVQVLETAVAHGPDARQAAAAHACRQDRAGADELACIDMAGPIPR